MEITIPYHPRNWAKPVHEIFKRWFYLILHRRAGKSTFLVNHFQRAALDNDWERRRIKTLEPSITDEELQELLRGRNYGIVFPTYKQAKNVMWEMLKWYASPIPGIKPNESELSIKYPTGNKVGLYGADNPDSLRGIAFWGLGFDEYSQQPSNIFSEVLSKSLADHLGFAFFVGTVKGKNQLYRGYKIAQQNPDEYFTLWQDIDQSLKTEEGITIRLLRRALEDDRKMVERGLMTQEEFDQEWYLSVDAAIKGAYYSKYLADARKEGRIKLVPYDPAIPVYTVWDLGKGQAMSIGFWQRTGSEMHLIDYWEGLGEEGLPQAIKIVKEKPYVYGGHFAPHDIQVKELSTEKTRLETARALGINFNIVPRLSVDDGINAVKMMFPRLWINEKKCEIFIENISQYRQKWDESKGMFTPEPVHDFASHAADMLRYAAIVEKEMTNENYSLLDETRIRRQRQQIIKQKQKDYGF